MRLLTALLLSPLLLVANSARAQDNTTYGPFDPYNWNVYNEGPGIKLGEGLVFHPGLATELGYDSNVLLNGNADQVVGAGLLRLRLHLDLSTLPPQRITGDYKPILKFFNLGAHGSEILHHAANTVTLLDA